MDFFFPSDTGEEQIKQRTGTGISHANHDWIFKKKKMATNRGENKGNEMTARFETKAKKQSKSSNSESLREDAW